MPEITTCLWFDTESEDAARFYTSVFPNSKITKITTRPDRPEGTVMTVEFELDGKPFVALDGGPQFSFSEAVSFQVDCQTQADVDALLGRPLRGRRGRPMRLAQGPLRRVVADRA